MELLFHSEQFNTLYKGAGQLVKKHFYVQQALNAILKYRIYDQNAVSLPSCPYAGVVLLCEIDFQDFSYWISNEIVDLGQKGVRSLVLKQPPAGPFPSQSENIRQMLLDAGFYEMEKEINHHIDLTVGKVKLHSMQKRKISKCERLKCFFQEEGLESYEILHRFIAKCREQQGLQINISLEKFVKTIKTLAPNYRFFSVRDVSGELMAATVTVRVSDDVVYNYLPAFDRNYIALSPMALLYHKLTELLRNEGIRFFDLGISSINSQIQKGLSDFKERMGAERSFRYTYQIDF